MSIPLPILELLLSEHQQRPLLSPVLSFGYPEIDAPYETVVALLRRFGVTPIPITESMFPGRADIGVCEAFFAHLGLAFQVLDIATERERATITHDLNEPIPAQYAGHFGTVLDSGVLEHVFDIRRAFRNVAELLRAGGTAIHINPMNNHVNHGFWQISPTAHFDYYEANAFTDLRAHCIVYASSFDYVARPFTIFPYDRALYGGFNALLNEADSMLTTAFFAVKTERSTSERAPIQSHYRAVDFEAVTTPRFVVDYPRKTLRTIER